MSQESGNVQSVSDRVDQGWMNVEAGFDDPFDGFVKHSSISKSLKTSSMVVPGQTPCFESTSLASQQDGNPSIRRTCSSERTPSSYAFAAKASKAILDGSPKGGEESSSGISRVICMEGW
jgi:hypothetical protein